jgi:RsiW-degrading membrane proteinase PrsW (M82 family)
VELLTYPLLAFAPAVFWFWFFARKDTYRPEPKRLIAATFFLGMLSTIPAGILNFIFLDESLMDDSANLASMASGMLFVVGPVEETSKFMAVYLLAYRSLYFDEPSDGLVYATAASLGFASLENLMYIFEFGPFVMIGRAPLSTVAHVIFGSFWGYALGKRTMLNSRGVIVIIGIAAAAVAHGLFNVFVFIFMPAAIALVILGIWWTLRRFDWARLASPFRYRRNYPRVQCPACTNFISVISRHCPSCGMSVSMSGMNIHCSNCNAINRSEADFCTRCGDRLLR